MPVLPSLAVRDGSYYEFWVYILTSRIGTLYVGVTGCLGTRIMQHKIDSIEGFHQKYKVHRLVYYESYEHMMTAIRREKQLKGWRRDKKITPDRKSESTMDGPGRELRPGNAVSGTVAQENALNRHGTASILGMVRLALASPALRARSAFAHHDRWKLQFFGKPYHGHFSHKGNPIGLFCHNSLLPL
ncbi:MAG TPA: GIY-YIG nuclease family protein [Candidatus Angelobacter sp.]|nr:GIY-YIG nuclease family protein [Candidatus Angelobacter sp.]